MLHGDIKPANILIKGDIFKLCDFGTTLVLDENKQCNFDDYTTTEPFMPPEGKCSIFNQIIRRDHLLVIRTIDYRTEHSC